MTENELLAMTKNLILIGNAGTPTKLAIRCGEKDANEWGEKYNVTFACNAVCSI
jgi:hypothetical protein